jgi:acyl-coenzyme A synthetase/AMP-(fatty) acid ligase
VIVVPKAGPTLTESRGDRALPRAHGAVQGAQGAWCSSTALPKNPSGKLLKRELRLRFEGHYGG